jgi:type IV pilus assembly protein PilP
MSMKRLLILSCSLALVACSSDEEDIRAWMVQQEGGMRGTVKPLPEVKPFPVVGYDANALVDPFAASRLEPEARSATRGGPDLDRRREPLEAFPLESLDMVGVLMQPGKEHALVKADNSLYQVKVGNYMGQNFGVVTNIAASEVTLKELVEDVNGDWVERTSKLLLQERETKR